MGSQIGSGELDVREYVREWGMVKGGQGGR